MQNHLARRYDQAIEQVTATIEMAPEYTTLNYCLGQVYERQGAYARAIGAFHDMSPNSQGRRATVLAAIGYTHARAGNHDAAIDALKELEELAAPEYVPAYEMALLHLSLGDKDRAFANLSKAYDECSSFLPFLNTDSRLDEVRTDRRFLALVERRNFPVSV